jgi:hypothetical protein
MCSPNGFGIMDEIHRTEGLRQPHPAKAISSQTE